MSKLILGWREWAELPELLVPLIKVKIDTGAKISALHTYDVKIIKKNNENFAKFIIHPIQRNEKIFINCVAKIIDMKTIKSTSGHKENRIVIRSPITIGNFTWDIDMTLTNRDIMNHRMLIGRRAMQNILIDPSKSFCQGKVSSKKAIGNYSSASYHNYSETSLTLKKL